MAHIQAQRGTHLGTLITHTGATSGVTVPLETQVGLGLLVFINITAITAGSLTVTLKGAIDEAASATYTILASAALGSTGLTVLRVYPGLTAAANLTVNDVVPKTCTITTAIATGPVTATISAYSLSAG